MTIGSIPGSSAGSRVRESWASLAPRERTMLAVMALAIAAFVLWLGIVRPLQDFAGDATQRAQRAAGDLREVQARVRDIRAMEANRPAPPSGERFAPAIMDAAAVGQVAIARQRIGDGGVLEVGIDAVAAPALFGWLEALRTGHSITPASLEVRERNGALQAEVSFNPPVAPP